jgi:hypothetical protein
MRQRASIKIDDIEYVIKELTMKEIISLLADKQTKKEDSLPEKIAKPVDFEKSLFGLGPFLDRLIELAFENNVTRERLMEHTPSELKQIYNTFKEVNAPFFEAAQYLNLGETLHQITVQLLENFSRSAVGSSKPGMPVLSTTDIRIS